ncbi:MAG: hypothetical protein IJD32_00660 [Bacteroidaceae bacterium]|nr:hypothetical protein [Bacteroidaceae bacterium]MBQ4055598.1 hypothetical protein [Bacteroidaceae bacterium]
MRLKTVAKLSVFISVLLFCVAVGFYAIARLDMTERNREVDLYSLVPSDCVGVLESDNISAFLNEIPSLNYGKELDGFQFPGLFEFLLHQLNEYAVQNAHGLSSQMNHLMVSFHAPGSVRDQVLYFRMGGSDQQMLEDMLKEYAPANFLPKEEKYRGKTIWVYPLGQDEFLAAYSGAGFMALSYQKRLIEQVIDAKLDKNSLNVDPVFSQILAKKKSHHFLTLYGRSAAMPFLNSDAPCWCEFEFHLNSDVLYLTGETYHSEPDDAFSVMKQRIEAQHLVKEDHLIVSADKDSTWLFMEEAYEANEDGRRTLFNECLANLSREAAFTLLTDMETVIGNPQRYAGYLPSFILDNAFLFRSFILSIQLSMNQERSSHIWVFTYKN